MDTHGAPVAASVWDLFDHLVRRIGPRPTLIEWDNDVPAFSVLVAEADQADRRLRPPATRLSA